MRLIDRVARGLAVRGARAAWGTLPGGEIAEALARAGIRYLPVRSAHAAGRAAAFTARLGGFPGIAVLDETECGEFGGSLGAVGRERVIGLVDGGTLGGLPGAILEVESLERQLARAWGGRRGVAALAVRREVGRYDVPEPIGTPEAPRVGVHDLLEIGARIRGWRRPVMVVGDAGRRAPIGHLAEVLRAPVVTASGARGAVPEGTGWSLGLLGDVSLADADGVLAIGWDPGDAAAGWSLPVPGDRVWLDEPGNELPPHGSVTWGPLGGLVAALAAQSTEGESTWTASEVADRRPGEVERGPGGASRLVRAQVGGGDVAVIDAGRATAELAMGWRCDRPDRSLCAPGWGGAAALAVAESGRRAVLLLDPPAFDRAWPELVAASEAELPFVAIILGAEGSLGDPVNAIRGLGGFGRRVTDSSDVAAAFRDVLSDTSGRVGALWFDFPWADLPVNGTLPR